MTDKLNEAMLRSHYRACCTRNNYLAITLKSLNVQASDNNCYFTPYEGGLNASKILYFRTANWIAFLFAPEALRSTVGDATPGFRVLYSLVLKGLSKPTSGVLYGRYRLVNQGGGALDRRYQDLGYIEIKT